MYLSQDKGYDIQAVKYDKAASCKFNLKPLPFVHLLTNGANMVLIPSFLSQMTHFWR